MQNPKKATDKYSILMKLLGGSSAFYQAQEAIEKKDSQAGALFNKSVSELAEAFTLTSRQEYALNRLVQVVENASRWDAALLRNNIFKAADGLGLKLPSFMFASGAESGLHADLVRLAHAVPETRAHLVPLLRQAAEKEALRSQMPRPFYLPPEVRGTEPNVDPKGTDLAIWTWGQAGKLRGIAFAGKADKPLWNYTFRSEAERDHYVNETIERRQHAMKVKQDRLDERRNFQHGLNVGDIFSRSWGYDQTQVDFYEVTEILGKAVVVREIAQREVASDKVMPIPGKYTGQPMKKIPGNGGGKPTIKLEYDWAYLWDGRPKYVTPWDLGR